MNMCDICKQKLVRHFKNLYYVAFKWYPENYVIQWEISYKTGYDIYKIS